jgi:hypothetical protein
MKYPISVFLVGSLRLLFASDPGTGDWPMWGGTPDRTMFSPMAGIPVSWDIKTKKNVKWMAELGSQSYGNPVVAGGQVYAGTNTLTGWVRRRACRNPPSGLFAPDSTTRPNSLECRRRVSLPATGHTASVRQRRDRHCKTTRSQAMVLAASSAPRQPRQKTGFGCRFG